MSSIKKVWIAPWEAGLVSLCFESENVEHDYERLKIKEMLFPAVPTKEHPLRHTVSVSLLSQEDIDAIAEELDKVRTNKTVTAYGTEYTGSNVEDMIDCKYEEEEQI